MSTNRSRTFLVLLSLTCLNCLQSGCSEDPAPAASRPKQDRVAAALALDRTLAVASGAVAAESEAAPPQKFEPPYPERRNLFQPPKAVTAQRPEAATAVALRGFVNVDGMRAILDIQGRLTPAEVGGQYAGIEVIAIEPPGVTLQRGRVRWTERLPQVQ